MSIITEYKKKVMDISREKKLQHFYSLFKEGQSVLDVGVSAELEKGLPARNYFLKNYRYAPESYTGLGVQDFSGMEEMFPGKRFVQYPGGKFPFSDKEFDWVFSNAVIEHVGDSVAQLLFLNEMMRVAKRVFFTTPHKYFPVEPHTNIIFLHWNNELFHQLRKKKRPDEKKYNIYLFSFHRLQQLLKKSNARSFSIYKNRFFSITMTFTVICTDTKGD